VLGFTVAYLIPFATLCLRDGNQEFLLYLAVMLGLIPLVAWLHARIGLHVGNLLGALALGPRTPRRRPAQNPRSLAARRHSRALRPLAHSGPAPLRPVRACHRLRPDHLALLAGAAVGAVIAAAITAMADEPEA
jgi:hypothetical protein